LRHDEYIADCETDGRAAIAQKLCDLIGDQGGVIAYGAQFERAAIKDLAEQFEPLRPKLLNILSRLVDLATPFEKRYYYDPNMRGSRALKAVAPAIIRGVAYDGGIKNGEEAMESYLALHSANEQNKERIRRELLDYCKKDTEYLAHIYRKLVTLTKPKQEV
jgi:hypothetical protein